MRKFHEGNGASRLPAVADELSGRAFSGQCPAKRREDDKRASQRIACKYFTVFSSGRSNFIFCSLKEIRD